MAEGMIGRINGRVVPVANPGERKILLVDGTGPAPFNVPTTPTPFSGLAGTDVLPASGQWLRSVILNVDVARRLAIEVAYNGHASGTAGYAQIIPLLSSALDLPLAGDDVWFAPGDTDGSLTLGALAAGTMPTGSDFTLDASWGIKQLSPLVIKAGLATAASAKSRIVVPIDVTAARWVQFLAREIGDTTNRGILNLAVVGTT